MVCLLISVCKLLLLSREPLSLVDRVVELGVGVRHLPAVHIELEALDVVGIFRLSLCERRYLDGMIHQERGLHQVFLHVCVEYLIEDVALAVELLVLYLETVCDFACVLQCGNFLPVDACIFLYGIHHGDAFKGSGEIHLRTPVDYSRRSQDLLCDIAQHALCQIHHSVVIGVCLVQLHHGELGIVPCVYPLVAEHSSDLKHPVKAAHYESLEVQLK